MKAIQMHGYGGVEQLRYEQVPTPIPGPNEVLVKLAATSVNPIDWKIRRGNRKAADIEQAGALPLVVSTGAELMERIGPRRGDTVLVTGALGEAEARWGARLGARKS
jgi:NADPH:quinone reductase-like Zn-dependent oxidoreductase